jgi:hypothetical protein
MGSDGDTLDPLLHELCCNFCFRLADIAVAEKELAVEVRDVDGICLMLVNLGSKSGVPSLTHINNMYLLKSRKSQVFQYLTTKASCAAAVGYHLLDWSILKGTNITL